ncbi:hypothetical protein LCGC14_2413040, partial [marine sediment metagenome]
MLQHRFLKKKDSIVSSRDIGYLREIAFAETDPTIKVLAEQRVEELDRDVEKSRVESHREE